jgi:asparagine synthase (glutamine-hydrolysing)
MALVRGPCAAIAKWCSQPKLAGVPEFFGSLEGQYFLRRGLFLPTELPALLGVDMAQEGLARLGGFPPGMKSAQARDGVSTVGLLESTHYLRNQLLRDSDWASMGHSLELRTPFVDVKLLEMLGPVVSSFSGVVGKMMLAQSPGTHLPESIVNRPKTGFTLPMAKWLSETTTPRTWADYPLLAAQGTPWARRWARNVVMKMAGYD